MISDISKVEVQMDYFHWLIHKGLLFFAAEVQSVNGTVKYTIQTGNLPLHYSVVIKSGGKTTINILKDVTITGAGSAITPQRYNSAVTSTSLLSTFQKGTTYTGGTTYKPNQAGFGTNPGQAQSGEGGQEYEYVIPPNASWAIELTTTVATDVVSTSTFYEAALS